MKINNIFFCNFLCFFKEHFNSFRTLCVRIKLKVGLFVTWYHLEILFFIEKFVIFFLSILFSYHFIFLKNFQVLGLTPNLFGFPIESFFEYITLQLLIFFLWGVFFIGFLILMYNLRSFEFWLKFFLFCFSIISLIKTASAGSEQEAAELATQMAYLQYLGDDSSKATFLRLTMDQRNLLARHFGNNFIGDIGWNSKGFLHLAALNQQGILFQNFTRDLVKEETVTILSSNDDFSIFKASRNNNLNNLLCVSPDKSNSYIYPNNKTVIFSDLIKDQQFDNFVNTKIDAPSRVFLSKLSIGDIVSEDGPIECKWRSVIDHSRFKKEFDLQTHLNKQVLYFSTKGVYFREPLASTPKFSELNIHSKQEDLSRFNLDVILKRKHSLDEMHRNPSVRFEFFDKQVGVHFSSLLKKLK